MSADYHASKLPPFTLLDEPLLTFSPDNSTARDIHPLRGLLEHGPYTASAFRPFTPQLRVATVGPVSGRHQVGNLMKLLRERHEPSDRKEYVPAFPGFERLFGVPLVAAAAAAHIRWPDSLDELGSGGPPTQRVSIAMRQALDRLSLIRDQFDVVVVHLPDSWDAGLRAIGFDAHDTLKAIGAVQSIPTQVVNDRAFEFGYKASLAWRLSIALYVKAGGVPWKLAPIPGVPDSTAYIGLAYALRGDPRNAHFVTCCSQVFDMDGGGMQFVEKPAALPRPKRGCNSPQTRYSQDHRLQERRSGGRSRRIVVGARG